MKNKIKRVASILLMFNLLFALGVLATPVQAANSEFKATDSNVIYTGHWAKSGDNMKGYFQSTFELKFTGTSLKIKSTKRLAVSIDGADWVEKEPTGNILTAASGLSNGTHSAVVIIPINNQPVVSGFILDDGASLLKPDSKKHVSFIGDSITLGHYGANGSTLGFKDSFIKNYASLTAKELGWVPNATATGGIGIVSANNGCDEMGMVDRYFKLGEYTSDAKNTNYDTSLYSPDYIVVALGTNNSYGISDIATASAYEDFIKKLRKTYSKATIFCVTPFMKIGFSASSIKEVVNDIRSAGDKNVYYIDATSYLPSNLTTDTVHPTYEGHDGIACMLVKKIKAILNGTDFDLNTSSYKTPSVPKRSQIQNTTTNEQESTKSGVSDTAGVKNNTSKKNNASKNTDSTVKENIDANEQINTQNEDIETQDTIGAIDVEQSTEKSIFSQYWWILAIVCGVCVIALLLVIFWPQIKTLLNK